MTIGNVLRYGAVEKPVSVISLPGLVAYTPSPSALNVIRHLTRFASEFSLAQSPPPPPPTALLTKGSAQVHC
jgi:hypothetical protein